MLDYKAMNTIIEEAIENEKKKSFDLGIPWTYGDSTGTLIIEEYKNGAKKIYKKFGDELKLIKVEPGKEGVN
ncbi:hypothetical protein [Clostridium pasteurianum]|jgi:hypothetical protein|uniref:Uncharacterized protein n=1 Tax=Clostridium pasteurianum BC1 TaxID=86416 RepID=R4K5J1_CLOPA|nr:hypothetical protein [Clostridium pasteurianum]AGK96961.1 hypothetical protein Clopa_2078 [Clostridium pasteurianum BC1]